MEASDDGDGSGSAPSTAASVAAFTITTELALSSDIPIACWCPTMDLCAVVSADGQLHLHRMDWQLLWAVSPEALVTAVTWRPDGKEIAAGHANGAISILDVETGDIVSEHKVHYAGISSICWCDQAADAATSSKQGSLFPSHHSMQPHQRYKRLFVPPILEPHPPSSTEPLPDPYEICMEAAGPASWPAERPGLSLLAAADVRGRISLWLQGQVQVAELTAAVMPGAASAGDAADGDGGLQEDEERYRLLHVLATSQLDQVMTINQSASGSVVVVSHSLQLLRQHQQPLQQCTALFSQLQSFLQAASKCVEVAASDWGSVMADFKKRFDVQLKQELSDHGSSVAVPQQELLLLLATGCCTSPLQSFLAHTLGEAGLRRLARSLDSTASGLHTALLERLMPLLELVLFLLGELRGCVACGGGAQPPTGTWMGLQVSQLQLLELHAAALLLRTEQLRRTLTATACQYRAFFTWLLKAVRQLEGSDAAAGAEAGAGADAGSSLAVCQEVLAFLKGQFLHDVVAPELSGPALTPDAKARAEALLYQGISPAETHQLLALLIPSQPQTVDANHASSVAAVNSHVGSSTAVSPVRLLATGTTAGARPLQQQQQQQQLKGQQLAEAVEQAAEACSRPLALQLQQLISLCEEEFEQPLVVISPSVAPPIAQLQLLPSAGAAATPDRQQAGSSSSSGVAVGPPLLQPKQYADLHSYVCCFVPAELAAAGGASQGQLLLVVKLPSEGLLAQQQHAVQAVLLQLPDGQSAVAWQFYKGQQLVLLLQGSCSPEVASAAAGGLQHQTQAGCSSLHLLQLSEAPWTSVVQEQQHLAAGSSSSVVCQCLQRQALVALPDLAQRSRQLQHSSSAGQLSVSRARGLASLVTDMQHLLLLDLEDDEQGEAEDGSDSDADMAED